ncbi:hypothetical protein PFICI_03242 [Pestalotiopsis fici W106-1]|uniref:Uncharacterized protein n=1 Tax=Pestalotiopsis fici (strain W106-1 / CGMCC3.15140) TaxID=1229662 RepID=W3XIG0_PESFW|nr:uncharacterized protein PFICI_03242 [Pestalotiopsis fici W106-1]ETS85217.1 hypothetical protein PFICI_03242 [Pestalotiopsis fici W106-1]
MKNLPSSQNAPCLRVTLECPAEISKVTDQTHLTIKVKYEGLSETGSQDAPSITFNKYGVMREDDLALYQLRDGEWIQDMSENDEYGGCCGFAILDAPPMLVNVSEDDQFPSLSLGEAVIAHQYPLKEKLPGDAKAGDRFRLTLKQARVEWWNWGGREEHANTKVYLPCWRLGPVVDPPTPDYDSLLCPETKNEGRPKLLVHIGDPVEFVLT